MVSMTEEQKAEAIRSMVNDVGVGVVYGAALLEHPEGGYSLEVSGCRIGGAGWTLGDIYDEMFDLAAVLPPIVDCLSEGERVSTPA